MQAQFKDTKQCLAHSRWLMTIDWVNEVAPVSVGKAVCSHYWVNSNFLTSFLGMLSNITPKESTACDYICVYFDYKAFHNLKAIE